MQQQRYLSELHPGFLLPSASSLGVVRLLEMPVPATGQKPYCRPRLSITPAGPVPLPRSGVIVFCRMKFTIRILSEEKLWLKAALGIQTCVVWPWKKEEGREKEGWEEIGSWLWTVRSWQLCTWWVEVAFCGK